MFMYDFKITSTILIKNSLLRGFVLWKLRTATFSLAWDFINRTARKVPTWKELTNCYDIREFAKVAINLKGNKMTLLLQLLERLLV